jgi:diguanylate cyclase (GGDEF)-like protein/PAS domain S-box-containing protein
MDATFDVGRSADADANIPVGDVVEAFLEQSREGVFVTDQENRIAMINARAEQLFGYDRRELLGRPVQILIPGGLPRPELEAQGAGGGRRWREAELNLVGRHKGESDLPVHVSVTYPEDTAGLVATVFVREAWVGEAPPGTEVASGDGAADGAMSSAGTPTGGAHNAGAAERSNTSLHDPLTGLPGRVLFMDRLSVALAGSSRRSAQVAVLLLDLDRFRLVNDSYGKEIGDRLLVAVAERMFGALRPGDTVARVDEDEFAILCDDIAKREGAATIAERIHDAVADPYTFEGEEVTVSGSIGFVVGSGQAHSPESLFRKAEEALMRAKDRGPSQVQAAGEAAEAAATDVAGADAGPADAPSAQDAAPPEFPQAPVTQEPVASTARAARAARAPDPVPAAVAAPPADEVAGESPLVGALQRGEFRLAYQPIVRLQTGRIAGVEALLRWEDPRRGLVSPGAFMAEAEETGLITHIGAWVLREVAREAEQLQTAHPEGTPLMLSVNLSARQLAQPDFVDVVRGILAGSRIDPGTLYLEVGESSVMEDADAAAAVLGELRSTGVRMSIDDFGTGFSSLMHLNRFPIDFLKIDGSFVEGIERDPNASNIVTAVISMAHALGMPTIAESVETDGQLYTLRRLGCDYAQGYLFARPQTLGEVVHLLTSDPVW